MTPQRTIDVVLLGFGEPDGASPDETRAYLERIFMANARLEEGLTAEQRRARCRELAARRAPGLQADYERIGGSPLLAQCRAQAAALGAALAARGVDARIRVAMQFTPPFIEDVAVGCAAAGAERVIAVPLYPLCGASTTVAALDALEAALAPWPTVRLAALSGWHAHPACVEAVATVVRDAMVASGADLASPGTLLYFSAHGTPLKYLREGSRYDRYVEESCRLVAAALGAETYALGYQNHSNRGLEWTQPSNEDLLPGLDAERLVVVPISFVHEQSETLVELDEDLRELAESHGKDFIRVPVPHDSDLLVEAWADIVEAMSAEPVARSSTPGPPLVRCLCRPIEGTYCLNGARFD